MAALSISSRFSAGVQLALVMSLLVPSAALAATRNVDRANAACNDVTGTPYCTVQAAVNASSAGDIIAIGVGSYTEQITIDRNVALRGAGTSLVAGTCGGQTNISGASPITVLAGVTAVVSEVTVKGSDASQGGGVFNAGTLTLLRSEVCENLAGFQGGGIPVAAGGRLFLTDVVITSNFADNTVASLLPGVGGGIYNAGVAVIDRAQIGKQNGSNVVLDDNGKGGGIYNAGSLLLTKSAITHNVIDLAGGVMGFAYGAGLYNAFDGTA